MTGTNYGIIDSVSKLVLRVILCIELLPTEAGITSALSRICLAKLGLHASKLWMYDTGCFQILQFFIMAPTTNK